MVAALDPHNHATILPVDATLLERADLLQKHLEERLLRHCQIRIPDEKKRKHWCLKLGAKNFPQVAAIITLFDHVKPDLSCLDHNQCLLATPSSFLKATSNSEASMQGCYVYYDKNNEEWIRSGKAVGSNFKKRHEEHAKEAKLTTAASSKSKFYNSYPSKSVVLPDASAKKGNFENLQMLVGIGFNKLLKGKLTCDFETQGGIFHFDAETNNNIDAVKFQGNPRLQQKQLHMLGYIWELAYDLCLAPGSNISGNPGFEAVLGIFAVCGCE